MSNTYKDRYKKPKDNSASKSRKTKMEPYGTRKKRLEFREKEQD